MSQAVPKLIISCGEPAGIGPDILLTACRDDYPADIVVVGDPALFHLRAKQLKLDIAINETDLNETSHKHKKNTVHVIPLRLSEMSIAGQLNSANANYVLQVLDVCIKACTNKQADAMVTGPIQKSILNSVYANFSGHTEYLAEKTHSELPVMMLATEGLRVALVTTHLPLKDIAAQITPRKLRQIITILHHDLQNQFGIQQPKIVVAGLNPHAGEDGHLGTEEIEIINPVLEEMRAKGMNLQGPLPADTLFTEKYLQDTDAVLAMYHDQGLPVLKYKGFGNAINVTLGLPIVRTSVDHGTALELAGSGKTNDSSMRLAINTAIEICKAKTS